MARLVPHDGHKRVELGAELGYDDGTPSEGAALIVVLSSSLGDALGTSLRPVTIGLFDGLVEEVTLEGDELGAELGEDDGTPEGEALGVLLIGLSLSTRRTQLY